MNDLFVNVKVDREERPDVDAHDDGRLRHDDRAGRLADDRVPHARRRAVLRGHVLPAGAAPRDPELPPAPRGGRRGWRERRDDLETQAAKLVDALGGAARLDRGRRGALAGAPRRGASGDLARDYEPAFGGFGTAPKFPPVVGARAPAAPRRRRRRSAWLGARSTGWRRAGSTTSSAEASTGIRSTRAGSSRTSRRCSTTTRSSPRRTSTAGS